VWTITHTIDAESPLANTTWEALFAERTEFTVLFAGIDSSTMAPLYHCHTYPMERVLYDAEFESMVIKEDLGRDGVQVTLDFSKFHQAQAMHPVNRN
jgi:hypothetical protein